MAENEVLDVGNPRRYKRWRRALGDPNFDAGAVADCLSEDFLAILRNKLRGEPLYLVLKACGRDRQTLQEAVVNFKDRAMAKLVEQAFVMTRSASPLLIAHKIAELLVDRVVGRANRYAFKHDHIANDVRAVALEDAAYARLEACKPEIVSLLVASLRGEPIRRAPGVPKERMSAHELNSRSLAPKRVEEKRTGEPTNV